MWHVRPFLTDLGVCFLQHVHVACAPSFQWFLVCKNEVCASCNMCTWHVLLPFGGFWCVRTLGLWQMQMWKDALGCARHAYLYDESSPLHCLLLVLLIPAFLGRTW